LRKGRLPLTALRGFEAAGRHLSFTRAADELHVSQAAISRQVRELEAALGQQLFRRLHRQVALTETGRQLLEVTTDSFERLAGFLDSLRQDSASSILTVSVEPGFASCFLVPRLDRFRQMHPRLDVAVAADSQLIDFRSGPAQLAIRFAAKARSWPRLQAAHLADVVMSPVMAPRKPARALQQPADLAGEVLLHEENRRGWSRWLAMAKAAGVAANRGPLYADIGLILQAARHGHGVALVDTLLAADDLAAGRLIKPFQIDLPAGAYWLVAPDLSRLSPAAQGFAAWLQNEIAAVTLPAATTSRRRMPASKGSMTT
jgi:LysR family glycine cleavage system transcriptional activator